MVERKPESEPYLLEGHSTLLNDIILEIEDNVDYGSTVDVRYLDNIRSIKDKIKSCIYCGEKECPKIKQRLDRHMLDHHSSTSNNKQRHSQSTSSYSSRNSSLTSDGQTSTSDILKDMKRYKRLLRNEILEWAKEIPIYPDQITESKKQNLVNKYVDKINDMFGDIYNDSYNTNLANKTDVFLNTLPGLGTLKDELRENIIARISHLNRKFNKNSYKNKQRALDKPEVKEIATSTLIDKLLNSTKRQHTSTNTVQEYYNEVIGPDVPYNQTDLNQSKRTSNATVQAEPALNNIYTFEDNLQIEQDEFKEIKILFKHKVLEWMRNIMENENYKFVNTNVDKNFISNILWDQLKQFLVKKSPGRSDKLVLKIKILDMIDSLPLSTAMLDPIYRDIIADDLNSRLQSVQDSHEISIESLNRMMIQNKQEILRKVYNPVERMECSSLSRTLSVFKSEHKNKPPRQSASREKSTVNESNQDLIKLNSDEIMYINKIVETILAWLNTLPKEFKNNEQKYDNIKYLAREIYDQTKLEEGGDITSTESDKFKSFIIRKWLNRFDFFENASDPKPYIDRLVKDLREIVTSYLERPEEPVRLCCGQQQAFEPELIMKKLILKFLEYTYSEDNVATRYLFAHLLKSELPNLCLPSRKEVYDSLEQYVSGGVLSFKKLDKELQYIMIISDLMSEIPLADSFTNKNRVEFTNKLAENIYVIERNAQDSNVSELYMVIRRFVEELPITILTDYNEIVNAIIDDLVNNVVRLRSAQPCCLFANSDRVNSPMDSKTLSDFIESFIRDNNRSLLEHDLKLEACSYRLVKEINKMIVENPDAFNQNQVYKRLTNNTLLGDETVRRFSTELNYAKEISDWINNLPLLPIKDTNDAELRTKKISDLVHKMAEYQEIKRQEPNNANVTANFKDYLEKWLLSFPLDSRKEIIVPVVTQQLLNRIERVNKEQQKKKDTALKPNAIENAVCQEPGPCCSYGKNTTQKKQDPARSIVETIEKWCNELPIEGDLNNVSRVKENIATKLYQTLGDLNANPAYHNDDLFKDALGQEINSILDNLPNDTKLNNQQAAVRDQLLTSVMAHKKLIKEKISGNQYKQKLENTIAMSIPNPINSHEDDPGFELYKDRLATLFILDNFDYSHDALKLKYEKILRDEIDKYSTNALKRNAMSITNEKMYNELYGTLFRVPIPNEDSISDIVEVIKTRCEIQIWFEKLPLKKSTSLGEALNWDKILAMLAKKLHEIENFDNYADDKMHKEIVKCLRRLPLQPGKEAFVDQFASELQARLKSTAAMRKCVSQVDVSIFMDKVQAQRSTNYEEHTQTPLPRCCKINPNQTKKPADLIIDIVESWCRALPIPANTQEEIDTVNLFKDNMVIKIIIKISELNMNPELFEDDHQYNILLDDELENIFATLPSCCNFVQNREALKQQLINAINSIKPQIIEENTRHKYKQELKSVVSNVLEKQQKDNRNPAVLNEIKNEIVDNFVIYDYYKEDIDGKQVYKMMIYEAVAKYLNHNQDDTKDSLMKSNQLMCELCKVPCPSENVLMDEVEEIRMKLEVTEFLDDLPLSINDRDIPIKNQIKSTLARRLSDLEKSGHSNEIEAKMKEEVKKCLRKINESIDTQTIETFIERLRNSEQSRKSHPPQVYSNCLNDTPQYRTHTNDGSFTTPPIFNAPFQTPQPYEPGPSVRQSNIQNENDQWISLLPGSPQNQMPQLPHNSNQKQEFYTDQRSNYSEYNSSPHGNNPCRACHPYGSRNDYNIQPEILSNENELRSIQDSIQDNQLSNQSYESREFDAGIRLTSTPNKNAIDGPLNCQLYGGSQNRSLSHQSYRRPAENRPVPYPNLNENQTYDPPKLRPALQYSQDEVSRPYSSQDRNCTIQGRPCNRFSQPQFEHQRQHEFDQEPRPEFTCNEPRVRCPNAEIPCIRTIPLSPGSNNSQVPSINIPSSYRPPCFSANQPKAYKPCRRPSPPKVDDPESCVRRMVKSHKQARLSEKQDSDDEDNCACKKKRNPKAVCVQMKKYCKICNNLNSYFSTLPHTRYPGFYYY